MDKSIAKLMASVRTALGMSNDASAAEIDAELENRGLATAQEGDGGGEAPEQVDGSPEVPDDDSQTSEQPETTEENAPTEREAERQLEDASQSQAARPATPTASSDARAVDVEQLGAAMAQGFTALGEMIQGLNAKIEAQATETAAAKAHAKSAMVRTRTARAAAADVARGSGTVPSEGSVGDALAKAQEGTFKRAKIHAKGYND